jgi:histidine phosphotransferase ChpT
MIDFHLAACLASRLCHDLVGPVGAIGNGLELLDDDDDPAIRAQSLSLVHDSAAEAARRLAFFRLAFGASGGIDSPLPLADARRAAEGFFAGHKASLDWPPALDHAVTAGSPPSPVAVRLMLNLVYLGAEAVARGGEVAARLEAASPWSITVHARGRSAALRPETMAALAGGSRDPGGTGAVEIAGDGALSSRTAHAHYASALAAAAGSRIVVVPDAGSVTLGAAPAG